MGHLLIRVRLSQQNTQNTLLDYDFYQKWNMSSFYQVYFLKFKYIFSGYIIILPLDTKESRSYPLMDTDIQNHTHSTAENALSSLWQLFIFP